MSSEIVRQERAPVAIGHQGIELRTFDEMARFCQAVAESGLAPKGMEKPQAIMVAVQMGMEVGLTPMAAIQNIAVINGRPGLFGDAPLALVRSSGLLEDFWEKIEGEGEDMVAICYSKRKGMSQGVEQRFSMAQARKANLLKSPIWQAYPDRMLTFRARAFNLRDNFGDVLKGLKTADELEDMQFGLEHAKPVEAVGGNVHVPSKPDPEKQEAKKAHRPQRKTGVAAARAAAEESSAEREKPAETEKSAEPKGDPNPQAQEKAPEPEIKNEPEKPSKPEWPIETIGTIGDTALKKTKSGSPIAVVSFSSSKWSGTCYCEDVANPDLKKGPVWVKLEMRPQADPAKPPVVMIEELAPAPEAKGEEEDVNF